MSLTSGHRDANGQPAIGCIGEGASPASRIRRRLRRRSATGTDEKLILYEERGLGARTHDRRPGLNKGCEAKLLAAPLAQAVAMSLTPAGCIKQPLCLGRVVPRLRRLAASSLALGGDAINE